MIFESLFLAFALGSQCAQEQTSAMEVQRMEKDESFQRKRFFEDQKRWKTDKFSFCGKMNDLQWNRILELLDLIDEGYFPAAYVIDTNSKEKALQRYGLENYSYKEVPFGGSLACIYLKMSDTMDYFDHGGTCRDWTGCDGIYHQAVMSWHSVRELLKQGKVIIGLPFGNDSEPQTMTTAEAREFMSRKMEERFQKYYKTMRG
jgi:hypothetical protein